LAARMRVFVEYPGEGVGEKSKC